MHHTNTKTKTKTNTNKKTNKKTSPLIVVEQCPYILYKSDCKKKANIEKEGEVG